MISREPGPEPDGQLAGPTEHAPPGIDASVPSVARVYDALLGGKDNFAVDRALAQKLMSLTPGGAEVPRFNRAILGRAVRYMARHGITQFLDLGAGLPTAQNTHEVAQAEVPDARVVYVDNDPIVLVHGRALLADNHSTAVVSADVRSPEAVLGDPEVQALIDLDRPVGLMMVGILHHLNDSDDPHGLVARYLDATAAGSYLFVTHFIDGGAETAAHEKVMLTDLGSGRFRTFEEVTGFFDGTELVEPGVVYNPLWRPDSPADVPDPLTFAAKLIGGGLGRKP